MIRLFLGVLIAGSAMFGWGYVWWDIMPDQLAERELFDKTALANAGFPGPKLADAAGAVTPSEDKTKVTQASLASAAGDETMSWKTMAYGYAHLLVSALFLGAILKLASPSLKGYCSRVGFVFVVGVFATLLMGSGLVIWFGQSMDFAVYNGLFYVTAAIIAGLFLAAFVSHQPKPVKLPVRVR